MFNATPELAVECDRLLRVVPGEGTPGPGYILMCECGPCWAECTNLICPVMNAVAMNGLLKAQTTCMCNLALLIVRRHDSDVPAGAMHVDELLEACCKALERHWPARGPTRLVLLDHMSKNKGNAVQLVGGEQQEEAGQSAGRADAREPELAAVGSSS